MNLCTSKSVTGGLRTKGQLLGKIPAHALLIFLRGHDSLSLAQRCVISSEWLV